jgi:hypothetical protein
VTTTTAGNRLAATIKYLRSAAGIGLGTTIICRVFFSSCDSVAWPQATV